MILRLLLFALLLAAMPAQAEDLAEKVQAASALLYGQSGDGGLSQLCTTTAFKKDQLSSGKWDYHFLSAAHCVGTDEQRQYHSLYVTFDAENPKTFHRARVMKVGYQKRGNDFLDLEVIVDKEQEWGTIKLGDDREAKAGDEVINVASPHGLGLQLFYGHVSKLRIDRPRRSEGINWTGAMLVQIPGNNTGSSGSAVVSVDQGAIIGILVGVVGDNSMVAIPISSYIRFSLERDLFAR